MSTAVHLLLPAQLYAEMLEQAQKELPNECCGLLAGTIDATGAARVSQRFPLVNAAASPREFLSEPKSRFVADREMRKEALEILAVYHSHPTTEPVPSRTDLERNYSPDVVNLIISLATSPPVTRAWLLTDTEYHPASWEIVDS